MARQTFSFTDLSISLHLIGQNRWGRETPCHHHRFTIKDPSEIEARYFPLTHVHGIHTPEGGWRIRDVYAVREDLAVESVLRQVSA